MDNRNNRRYTKDRPTLTNETKECEQYIDSKHIVSLFFLEQKQ